MDRAQMTYLKNNLIKTIQLQKWGCLCKLDIYFGKISCFITSGAAVCCRAFRAFHFQDHGQRLSQLTPISRRDCGVPLSPFRSLWFGS